MPLQSAAVSSILGVQLVGLGGLQGDTADAHPTLVAYHGGHEGPAVSVWVVHLHRAQVGLSIVPPHGVEPSRCGHQRNSAAPSVHGHKEAPLSRCRAEHLGPAQEARAVVTPGHIHVAAQRRRPMTTALVQHGSCRVPAVGVVVVVLHLEGGVGVRTDR